MDYLIFLIIVQVWKFLDVTSASPTPLRKNFPTVAATVVSSTETTWVTADHVRPDKFPIYRAIIYHLYRIFLGAIIYHLYHIFHRAVNEEIEFKKWMACPQQATVVQGRNEVYFFVADPVFLRKFLIPDPKSDENFDPWSHKI